MTGGGGGEEGAVTGEADTDTVLPPSGTLCSCKLDNRWRNSASARYLTKPHIMILYTSGMSPYVPRRGSRGGQGGLGPPSPQQIAPPNSQARIQGGQEGLGPPLQNPGSAYGASHYIDWGLCLWLEFKVLINNHR